jgi:hypothetical protein
VRFPVHIFASWPSGWGVQIFARNGPNARLSMCRNTLTVQTHAARKHSSKEEEEEEEPEFDSSGDEI